MNISEILVGSTFVTSLIPIERAICCGIVCSSVESLPDGKTKVAFKRMSGNEEFLFFSDEHGNIQIGNWIPCKNLESVIETCRLYGLWLENDKQTILVAEKNLKETLLKRDKILKESITFTTRS
jgi:hypothetical protein